MGKDTRALEERWKDAGRAIDDIGLAMQGKRDIAVDVTGFSVRGPTELRDEFLIVMRGIDHEGAPVVAFHGSFHLDDAICGVQSRLRNGTLKWRPDEFA